MTKRWLPGGPSPNPAGRKKLPEWLLNGEAPDALMRVQRDAAIEGVISQQDPADPTKYIKVVVPIRDRLYAAQMLLDRVYGRAPLDTEAQAGSESQAHVINVLAQVAIAISPKGGKK